MTRKITKKRKESLTISHDFYITIIKGSEERRVRSNLHLQTQSALQIIKKISKSPVFHTLSVDAFDQKDEISAAERTHLATDY